MTQTADADIDRVLADLESDAPATRRAAVNAAIQLGDRAVRALPVLQRMAAQDPVSELRYHARKGLHLLALEASLKGQGAPPPPPAGTPERKSAKITQLLAEESLPVVAQKINSSNPNVRASALRAAAIKQDKRLVSVVVARMGPANEPDAELRAIQVRVLAVLGGKEQLKNVAAYLEDPDAECRATAVDTLAQLRDVMAFPFIVRALQDADAKPKQRAAAALTKVGPVNILKICELMISSDRAWSRDAAVHCLAVTRLPEGVRLLEQSLSDPEEPVRQKARAGLERMAAAGVAGAREALAKAAPAPQGPAGEAVAKADTVVEARPADDLASPEPTKRRVATKQLIALDGALDESHLPRLTAQLKVETDVPVIVNLLTALGRIRGADVVPIVAPFLKHADETVRASVVDTLATLGTPPALAALPPTVNDASPVVIGRALVALKKTPGVDVLAELTKMAAHADPRYRTTAVYVITELGEAPYIPLVQKLCDDADPGVASLAQDAAEILAPVLEKDLKEKEKAAKKASAPVAKPTGAPAPKPVTRPNVSGQIKTPPPLPPPSGGDLKVPAGLLSVAGLAWLVVAAWHLSGAAITGLQMGLAGASLLCGLGGLFAGYAVLRAERWALKPGLAVAALHALLGLVQPAVASAALAALALPGMAAGALLWKERARFD